MRRYAYRGLVFTRKVYFNVVNNNKLVLEDDSIPTGSITDATTLTAAPMTSSIWRTRTRSGSSSSQGARSSSSSRQTSPATARTIARRTRGLQADQEQVIIPAQTRIDELSDEFYDHLAERLTYLASQRRKRTPEEGEQRVCLVDEHVSSLTFVSSRWR